MKTAGRDVSRGLESLEPVLNGVAEKLSEAAATIEAWNEDGSHFASFGLTGEFCRLARAGGCECLSAASETAGEAVAEGHGLRRRVPWGCLMAGAPLNRRRRRIGAVTVCFPPMEFVEDEELLARMCDRFGLDLRLMRQIAEGDCVHSADEADNVLRVLQWSLDYEQRLYNAEHELQTLSTNLATAYEELSLLYRTSGSMRVTQQPEEFLGKVCDGLVSVMGVSAVVALVYAHRPGIEKDLLVVRGRPGLTNDELRHLTEAYVAPQLISHKGYLNNDFDAESRENWTDEIRSVIASPLTAGGHMGVLLGINKLSGEFSSVDMKLLGSIADQVTAFLTNNRLYAEVQDLLMGVLHALTATIDAKDPYTCGHSQRVAMYSRLLAEACGLPSRRVEQIYLAGLLHDIGKIGVPDGVLCKPGKLTDDEYDMMKRHPGAGAKILNGIRQMGPITVGILTHHERPDGRGYPRGLTGDEIPIEGAIIGLADAFDAMTSQRTYRAKLSVDDAVEEIRRNAGAQFDANLVEKLMELDPHKLVGELSRSAVNISAVFGEAQQ